MEVAEEKSKIFEVIDNIISYTKRCQKCIVIYMHLMPEGYRANFLQLLWFQVLEHYTLPSSIEKQA
jgi:hypothetical protein